MIDESLTEECNVDQRNNPRPPFTCAFMPWMHIGAFVALIIYVGCISRLANTFDFEFFERDPTQSYGFDSDTVPTATLEMIALLVPTAFFVALFFLIVKLGDSTPHLVSIRVKDTDNSHYFVLLWAVLGLLMCLVGEGCLVESLKCLVGRHRPSFFYLCDYKGYKNAVDSGDYTEYNNLTTANAIGDLSYCRASAELVDDAQKSFPSGHAATSFCSMLFLVFFIRWAICVPSDDIFWSFKGSIAASPMLLAIWITITRLQDYKHSFTDVLTGAIIGSIFAFAVWRNIEKKLAVYVKDDHRGKKSDDNSMIVTGA